MAAPHVAGAAARILGMNPAFTPAQVWDAINAAATTVNFGPANPDPNKLLYVPTPPAAPAVAPPTTGDETMTVSWTEPLTTGDSPITSYTARAWSALTDGTQLRPRASPRPLPR